MERRLAAIMAADAVGYSRMMREDEAGALALLHKHRAEVIDPGIAKHRGRIVKLMGDGLLAEFSSVVEAIDCAAEIQRAMAARNRGSQGKRQMAFRVGVHLGDIIVEGDDLYGDGVNIASRLEGIAEHGGICISRQAYDQVEKKLSLGYRSLGPQQLKNIPEAIEIFPSTAMGSRPPTNSSRSAIVRTADGVRLAYAVSGNGPPLVKTGNWLNHLEYDWESPIWRYLFVGLSRHHRLIRYDPRGTGLSDWDVADISLDAWVNDVATVVEAAGLDRFPLLGYSKGCAVSIAYAVRNPDRSFAADPLRRLCGRGAQALTGRERAAPGARDPDAARMGRRQPGHTPVIRRAIDARRQQATGGKFQRSAAQDYFSRRSRALFRDHRQHRHRRFVGQVKVPTLVMHARGDAQVPIEAGRQLAAGFPAPNSLFCKGNNHALLEQDPATSRFFEELELFLK